MVGVEVSNNSRRLALCIARDKINEQTQHLVSCLRLGPLCQSSEDDLRPLLIGLEDRLDSFDHLLGVLTNNEVGDIFAVRIHELDNSGMLHQIGPNI